MAQVAWPGVQPSPLGGGEAPTTQEPQPEAKPKPEATPEATLVVTSTEVIDKGDGTADAAEDTDYAVDMAAAQSSWDPWPAPAQDTSLPTQDAPSSPHDDPTLAQQD